MKKPSTQIVQLIDLRLQSDGTAVLSADDIARVKALTKAIDKRDQELRKHHTVPRSAAAKRSRRT